MHLQGDGTAGAQSPSHQDPARPIASLRPDVVQVRQVRRQTRDTWTLEIEAPPGWARMGFLPGQFNMLYAFGVGEVPISISGDPAKTDVIVHTIRAVGAVTRALVELHKGDALGVRGPFGNPWPLAEAAGQDVVIVSGGLGIVSLRPLLLACLKQRDAYGRLLVVHGARTPADVVYKREMTRWKRSGVRVELTADRGDRTWRHRIGVVTSLLGTAQIDAVRAVAFVCGPEIMMRFATRELQRLGVAAHRIYVSLERNMQCAVGVCGHCQFGPEFVCMDGPVFRYDRVHPWMHLREV